MAISKQQKVFYRQFSNHGAGDAAVELPPKEVMLLIHLSYNDLYGEAAWFREDINELIQAKGYFEIGLEDLERMNDASVDETYFYLAESGATYPENIIYLYLSNFCDYHRRRFKYRRILSSQRFPTVEQIGNRALLEYGNAEDGLLFNWLYWRKWIYDIDNRSAQETGYIYEPILINCLGGESLHSTRSPVKRINENGETTDQGRQIDCYIEENGLRFAYELKLRVTIAASGQGRFAEELSFPKEAARAGIVPVLLVLDPTPSALLTRLSEAYINNNGQVFIGTDAWQKLVTTAGEAMGRFIQNYIEPPIKSIEEMNIGIPSEISLHASAEAIIIRDANQNEYVIRRQNN